MRTRLYAVTLHVCLSLSLFVPVCVPACPICARQPVCMQTPKIIAMEKCRSFVLDYLDLRDPARCCDIISKMQEPIVEGFVNDILSKLASVLPMCFSNGWSDDRTRFVQQVCNTLTHFQMNESVSDLIDLIVVSLVPVVNWADPASGLVEAYVSEHQCVHAETPQASFWSRFVICCEKR